MCRKLSQYCGNVALKINTKLGGTTAQIAGAPKDWAPFLKDKHVMVGRDIGLPIPDSYLHSLTLTLASCPVVIFTGHWSRCLEGHCRKREHGSCHLRRHHWDARQVHPDGTPGLPQACQV